MLYLGGDNLKNAGLQDHFPIGGVQSRNELLGPLQVAEELAFAAPQAETRPMNFAPVLVSMRRLSSKSPRPLSKPSIVIDRARKFSRTPREIVRSNLYLAETEPEGSANAVVPDNMKMKARRARQDKYRKLGKEAVLGIVLVIWIDASSFTMPVEQRRQMCFGCLEGDGTNEAEFQTIFGDPTAVFRDVFCK